MPQLLSKTLKKKSIQSSCVHKLSVNTFIYHKFNVILCIVLCLAESQTQNYKNQFMLFWKEWKRGESRIKEIMTERRELGEGWGRNKRRKGRKKKKKREGETLFQAVKMNLHISFFFGEHLHKSLRD